MALEPLPSVFSVNWKELTEVKKYAEALALRQGGQTVILRPGAVMFSVIPTAREAELLRGALVAARAPSP